MKPPVGHEWDVFIAHASDDKAFVRPLAEHLRRFGAEVWYDEFTITPGDSLIATIDRGLATSRYGALVLSEAFFKKQWPKYERQGLTARELAGKEKVVLPIWLDVTLDEVMEFSPPLADKYAIRASSTNALKAALEVLAVVRSDLFGGLYRRVALEKHIANLPKATAAAADLKQGPIQHQTLAKDLLLRIRVVQQALYDVFPVEFDETVRNFQRDTRPEREVCVWEGIVAGYLQLVREDNLDDAGKREVLSLFLTASMRPLTEEDNEGLSHTTVDRVLEVRSEIEKGLSVLEGE